MKKWDKQEYSSTRVSLYGRVETILLKKKHSKKRNKVYLIDMIVQLYCFH